MVEGMTMIESRCGELIRALSWTGGREKVGVQLALGEDRGKLGSELTIMVCAYTALTNRWISRAETPMDKRSLRPSRMSRHCNSSPSCPGSNECRDCGRACVWMCGRRTSYTCLRVGRPSLLEVVSSAPGESGGNILGELAFEVEEEGIQAGKEEGVMWMNVGEVDGGSGVPYTF